MAAMSFYAPEYIGTIGGHKVTLNPGVRNQVMRKYRPLARCVQSNSITTATVGASFAYLQIRTNNKDLQVHVFHPTETDGEPKWLIYFGSVNDGSMYEDPRYLMEFDADTPPLEIGQQVDHLVLLVNSKAYRDSVIANKKWASKKRR